MATVADTQNCKDKNIAHWFDCTPWYIVLVSAISVAFLCGCLIYFFRNLMSPLDPNQPSASTVNHNNQIKNFITIATIISFVVLVGIFFIVKMNDQKCPKIPSEF